MEAALALGLQEKREGLSVTKPALCSALRRTDVPFTSENQQPSFKLLLLCGVTATRDVVEGKEASSAIFAHAGIECITFVV